MSFVPLDGPATLHPAQPPRHTEIEFTGRRTLRLPIRSAIPVLSKALRDDTAHESVQLLASGVMLGMQLVSAGKFEPAEVADGEQPHWQVAPLDGADQDRLTQLVRARTSEEWPAHEVSQALDQVLGAVIDSLPRSAPEVAKPEPKRSDFSKRLQERIKRVEADRIADGPELVDLKVRIEADEGELLAGRVRAVLQVHAHDDLVTFCEASLLWTDGPAAHGFGVKAVTHAAVALRQAARAWEPLSRLLELSVPDQITLEGDDLASLLDGGVEALTAIGVDVLWPRSLGRDLTARAVLTDAERTPSAPGGREVSEPEPLVGAEQMFAFKWQMALDDDPLTDEEMEELAAASAPLLKLRGQWMVVDPSVARKAKKRLIRQVPAAQAVAATLTGVTHVGEEETPVIAGATLEKVRRELVEAATREPIRAPEGLTAELREYQRHGLTWLADLTDRHLGACLADDMGLGKTITLIALHLYRRDRGATGPTLVVCPASLMGNWGDEVAKFAPGQRVARFHGGKRAIDREADVIVTTYGTMRRDAETLGQVSWAMVVADEAQHVKNANSATAKALRQIDSGVRVALTGTPVENNLTELWAILDWATPGLLGSRNAFKKRWAAPIESGHEPTKARQFAALIDPFLLRRRKSDPGIAPELPAKTETDQRVGLTREQVVLYESFVRDSMERIEQADEDARRGLILAMLTGLKQICNHPAQFLKQSSIGRAGRSGKLGLLDELLGTVLAEDGAVLVFTQYVAMARLIEAHLSKQGIPHQFLHGGTPVTEREEMVRTFQSAPDDEPTPVFLLSLKAGGTGLNLTRADHVIHFDRWWNPAVEDQATDRAHRIGQTRPVQVHRFICHGTLEDRIDELINRKRSIADAVLGGGDEALTELSDADLRKFVRLERALAAGADDE